MKDTYKGASDQKRIARSYLWDVATKKTDGPYLVLASREGGDISAGLAWGAKQSEFTAVDSCPDAAASCAARWPDATVRVGDVRQYIDDRFNFIHLDFCCNLEPVVFDCLRLCTPRIGRVLAVTTLKGREMDKEIPPVFLNRQQRRALKSARVPELRGRVKDKLRSWEAECNADGRRSNLLWRYLLDAHTNSPFRYIATEVVPYQSDRSPMLTVVFEVVSWKEAQRLSRGMSSTGRSIATVRGVKETIKSYALRAEHAGVDAALALDLPRSTIAAWKAHETRGTYARAS